MRGKGLCENMGQRGNHEREGKATWILDAFGLYKKWELPEIKGTFSFFFVGVPIIRIRVSWGLIGVPNVWKLPSLEVHQTRAGRSIWEFTPKP